MGAYTVNDWLKGYDQRPNGCVYACDERTNPIAIGGCNGQSNGQRRAVAPAHPAAPELVCSRSKHPASTGQASSERGTTCARATPSAGFSLVHQQLSVKRRFNIMAVMRILQRTRGGGGLVNAKMKVLTSHTNQPLN